MASKAKRHTHKYHQVSLTFGKVWACALPDCSHYMPLHMSEMVAGKNSLCWGCDKVFILDEDNMQNSKPICDYCIHKQKETLHNLQIDRTKLSEALDKMGLLDDEDDDDKLIAETFKVNE